MSQSWHSKTLWIPRLIWSFQLFQFSAICGIMGPGKSWGRPRQNSITLQLHPVCMYRHYTSLFTCLCVIFRLFEGFSLCVIFSDFLCLLWPFFSLHCRVLSFYFRGDVFFSLASYCICQKKGTYLQNSAGESYYPGSNVKYDIFFLGLGSSKACTIQNYCWCVERVAWEKLKPQNIRGFEGELRTLQCLIETCGWALTHYFRSSKLGRSWNDPERQIERRGREERNCRKFVAAPAVTPSPGAPPLSISISALKSVFLLWFQFFLVCAWIAEHYNQSGGFSA